MSDQPGWFPDPYGRFQQRYHDGTTWTAHVTDGAEPLVDPMGTTLAIPFGGPVTGQPRVAGTTPTRSRRFLDSLGPDAVHRPQPDVTIALAGIGGAVAATGLLLIATDITTLNGVADARAKLTALSILLLGVVYTIRFRVTRQRELRSSAVGAGVVGIFGLAVGIAFTTSSQTFALALLAVLYGAAWVLPGLRGRPLLLGLAALALVTAVSSLAGGDQVDVALGVRTNSGSTGQSIAFLLAGASVLAVVLLLDRTGYHGVATSVLVAGLIATVFGAIQVVGNLDSAGGSFLLALVGIVVCIVGTHGARRASVWLGAAIASLGVVAFVVALVEPGSVSAASATLLGSAAVLIGGPLAFEMVRSNRVTGPAADRAAPSAPDGGLPPPRPSGD